MSTYMTRQQQHQNAILQGAINDCHATSMGRLHGLGRMLGQKTIDIVRSTKIVRQDQQMGTVTKM